MKIFKFVFLVNIVLAMLSACASHSNDPFIAFKGQTVNQIYQNAKEFLVDRNFSQAIKAYEALDVLYPFNRYDVSA